MTSERVPLAQRVRQSGGQWAKLGRKRHFEGHPHDFPCPPGFVRVRVDAGDAETPITARRYVMVKTGSGVALKKRVERARLQRA
jgi:hypothetical protein